MLAEQEWPPNTILLLARIGEQKKTNLDKLVEVGADEHEMWTGGGHGTVYFIQLEVKVKVTVRRVHGEVTPL